MTHTYRCPLCHEPVEPGAHGTYQKLTGWAKDRKQGGTNAVRLREPLDLWAHGTCIDREARKVSAMQAVMF